jgi:hypothetical protein
VRLLHDFSPSSLAITLVPFAFAPTVRGVTHDLLLESAVFLVSIKLMLMTSRNTRAAEALDVKLVRSYQAVIHRDGARPRGPEAPSDNDIEQSNHE